MVHILAVLIYLGIAVLIYKSVMKHNETGLEKRSLILTLLAGAIPCTVCIAVLELTFDRFIFKSSGNVAGEVITSFFRAGLIEEGVKLLFSVNAVKKHSPSTRIEYILICGMVGAGYGLSEKLAYGGGLILIANAVLPLHIFFQFLMGSLLFDAFKFKNDGNYAEYKRLLFRAFLMPFLVHSLWDSLLAVSGGMLESESGAVESAGFILFSALLIFGFVSEIKIIKKLNNGSDKLSEKAAGL